jgi:hypothetical protein
MRSRWVLRPVQSMPHEPGPCLVPRHIVNIFDFAATLTRPARRSTVKLTESKTAQHVWLAVLLTILGSIILSLVTGEGSGPG